MGRLRKRDYIYIVLGILLIIIALMWPNINITTSPSLSKRIFYRINKEKIEKGDYVAFALPYLGYSSVRKYTGKITTKKAICLPGEILTTQNNYAYCDGKLVSIAKTTSKKGEKLEPFTYNGKIPEGNYYVVGDNPDSLDSRYFGFVKKEAIKGVYIALF